MSETVARRYLPPTGYARYGGTIADLPPGAFRRWPTDRTPRLVNVRVTRYSMGVHYYVTIEEDDNPSVVDEGDCLVHVAPWDDPEGKGRQFHRRCHLWADVRPYVAGIIAEHFSGLDYQIIYPANWEARIQHLYERDGD